VFVSLSDVACGLVVDPLCERLSAWSRSRVSGVRSHRVIVGVILKSPFAGLGPVTRRGWPGMAIRRVCMFER
jgi:hypothetical protein